MMGRGVGTPSTGRSQGAEEAMASPSGRTLRKRKSLDKDQRRLDDLAEFFQIAAEAKSVLVFSGSGMSASAGLSTFTSPGGLYERAKKRFKVKDGIMLFCDSFYRKRGKDVRKVMGEIFFEATSSCPTLAHEALGRLEASGRLLRHVGPPPHPPIRPPRLVGPPQLTPLSVFIHSTR